MLRIVRGARVLVCWDFGIFVECSCSYFVFLIFLARCGIRFSKLSFLNRRSVPTLIPHAPIQTSVRGAGVARMTGSVPSEHSAAFVNKVWTDIRQRVVFSITAGNRADGQCRPHAALPDHEPGRLHPQPRRISQRGRLYLCTPAYMST